MSGERRKVLSVRAYMLETDTKEAMPQVLRQAFVERPISIEALRPNR